MDFLEAVSGKGVGVQELLQGAVAGSNCGREDKEAASIGQRKKWGCGVVSTKTRPTLGGP